jgi:hypothetical protein
MTLLWVQYGHVRLPRRAAPPSSYLGVPITLNIPLVSAEAKAEARFFHQRIKRVEDLLERLK